MAASSTSSDDCSAFIAAHDDAELLESGKVRCKVTGHEMPQRLALLEQYWAGSKYANAKKRAAYDFAQHEPWIVAHKKSATLLYCTLTKSPVSKEAKAVQGHINGKRFKRLLAEALNPPEKKQKRPRDDDDDEDDDEDEGEDVEDEEAAGEEAEGDGDDAAEFFAEGAFWEKEEPDGEEDDEEAEPEEEDDEEAFWVRGSGEMPPEKSEAKGGKKPKKVKAAAKEEAAASSEKPKPKAKAGREPSRVKGRKAPVKSGKRVVG